MILNMLISLLVGSFFCYLGYKHIQNITLSDQIMFIVISFVYVPLLISIPYYYLFLFIITGLIQQPGRHRGAASYCGGSARLDAASAP